MLELETSEARSEFFGSQEVIKGKIETLENSITKINAVTAVDIQKLARDIFVDAHLNMAIIGKMKDASQFMSYFTLGS
jgi:predicted Zn-dependent peptidase